MSIIKIQNLNFSYQHHSNILNSLNLDMQEGDIFGLIGNNGVGKTTLIKILLGLYPVPSDTVYIFGMDVSKHRDQILSRIGSFIESPTLYNHITTYQYLKIKQLYCHAPVENIDKCLEIVKLDANISTHQLSLGMKQRLAIANALINDPQLLILDEPTNGLDPNGMVDVRNLLLDLNQNQGISILISSHLLSEIEKIVTRTLFLGNGKTLFEGTLDDLMANQKIKLSIMTDDNSKAKKILAQNYQLTPIDNASDELIYLLNNKQMIPKIIYDLVHHNLSVLDISREQASLESIFLDYL